MTADPSLTLNLSMDCRCVRCKLRREVSQDSELTVTEKESLTYIVVTQEPCECVERRVMIKARFEVGF